MKFKLVDFNKDFNPDYEITNPEPMKSKQFTEDGIFSETIFGKNDDNEMHGAWVNFGDHYIINPLLFPFLKKVFPRTLVRIIKTEKTIDLEGNIVKGNPIDDIGLIKFYKDFDYYLDEYGDKTVPEYDFIMNNRDILFINKMYVIPAELRPGMLISDKSLVYDAINDTYNFILQYSKYIKESDSNVEGDLQINSLLYSLQEHCNQHKKDIIDGFLKTKKGFFRNNLLGSRINYSARAVIGPLVGHRIDEVSMPYKVYLGLYKKLIINLIVSTEGVSYRKASNMCRKAFRKFDPKVYSYMLELNKKTVGGQYILLNRNPSISVGSILLLKVKIIKPDYDDDTLQISNNLLDSLSGDYDGWFRRGYR